MTAKVFKISPDKLVVLREILLRKQSIKSLPLTSPYESFRIEHPKGLIVGYTSGKIVVNTSAAALLVGEAIRAIVTEEKEYGVVIGSDEAGKGEWLGPMIIAAVALDPTQATLLISKGVMDSKLINPRRIVELAGVVRADSVSHRIITINPRRFDQLFEEVKKESKSLNDILAWGHAKAIENVHKELLSKRVTGRIKVVIDEFDKLKTEDRLKRVLDLKDVVLEQKPRAEEETAVAAASILARASWEEWVDRASRRLHLDLRSISKDEALCHKDAHLFAKVSYLHRKE